MFFNFRRFVSIFLIVCIPFTIVNEAQAQKNNAAGEIIGAAAAAVAFAAFEIHQIYEWLELLAMEHVLEEYPDIEANGIEVKVFELPSKSLTDISNEGVIVFSIRFYDLDTYIEKNRKILMAHTSPGWVNEYGLEFSLLEWHWYDSDRWRDFWHSFIDISTPFEVTDGLVPVIVEIDRSNFMNRSNQFFIQRFGSDKSRTVDFYQRSDSFCSTDSLRLTSKGFSYYTAESPKSEYLPQYNLTRDQYVFGSLEPGITLVSNEGTVGIFRKSTGTLVQMRRSMVNRIQEWLHSPVDPSGDSNSIDALEAIAMFTKEEIQVFDQNNAYLKERQANYDILKRDLKLRQISKSQFESGDIGYIEIEPQVIVSFRLIRAITKFDGSDTALTIVLREYDVGKEIEVWASDNRLIWVSEPE